MTEVLAERDLPSTHLTLVRDNPDQLGIVVERWGNGLPPWVGEATFPLELDYEAVEVFEEIEGDGEIESLLQKFAPVGAWEDYQLFLSALDRRG